jgi:uncharacterized protein YqeY
VVPIGKKRSGSESRQAPSSLQSVTVSTFSLLAASYEKEVVNVNTFTKSPQCQPRNRLGIEEVYARCVCVRKRNVDLGVAVGTLRFGCRAAKRRPTMSIQEQLIADQRTAMKTGDRPTLNVIRQIQTEVSQAKSAPGFEGDVDDDLYVATIGTYVKRMDKARIEYEGFGGRGREQAEKLAFEIEYLSRFLPVTLGEEDTRAIVRRTIDEIGADDPKMAGRVIGAVMKSNDGLDGSLVARLVGDELSS